MLSLQDATIGTGRCFDQQSGEAIFLSGGSNNIHNMSTERWWSVAGVRWVIIFSRLSGTARV